jgi:hypothetical protein
MYMYLCSREAQRLIISLTRGGRVGGDGWGHVIGCVRQRVCVVLMKSQLKKPRRTLSLHEKSGADSLAPSAVTDSPQRAPKQRNSPRVCVFPPLDLRLFVLFALSRSPRSAGAAARVFIRLYVRVSANAILCQNCGWKLRITPVRAG